MNQKKCAPGAIRSYFSGGFSMIRQAHHPELVEGLGFDFAQPQTRKTEVSLKNT